jgi:hypothetical protein
VLYCNIRGFNSKEKNKALTEAIASEPTATDVVMLSEIDDQ